MAYPNHLIIEGLRDSLMADPDNAAIGIWLRCKTNAEATTPDGTAALVLAAATERGQYVTLQPIAAGAYGAVALMANGGGTLMGQCVGTINSGDNVYGAANGKVSASSAGGAVLLGTATTSGADGGYVVWAPNPAAA